MSGISLLEVIKTHSPAAECIMVSGIDDAKAVNDCLEKGAHDYLVQPFSKEDLISSINRALKRR